MRSLLLSSVFSLAATIAAVAADYPKGTYFGSGTNMCLYAPSGFSNDSKGNATIPNGNNSFTGSGTFEALVVFNGDGTGRATGTYMSITPPPPDSRAMPKPSIGGGTFMYDFTATPVADHWFSITAKPGTSGGAVEFGPAAGQQYSVDVTKRRFIVSDDQKAMAVTVDTPYVERVTSSGSPDIHTSRSCMVAGNFNRMD